jgi:hypothetical protein
VSGAVQDFTGPVPYTVTAADLSTVTYTVTVTASVLSSVTDIAAWIDEQTALGYGTAGNPVPLALAVTLDSAQWGSTLSTIAGKGKYVTLDLTDCAAGTHSSGGGLYSNGTFDPGTVNSGEQYVTALILPAAAANVRAGVIIASTFRYFTALKSAGGAGITGIGNYAFLNTALTSVSFPAAETIGQQAFYGCTALTSVYLPAANTTGDAAFYNCTNLTSVDLPAAAVIDWNAFDGCTALTSVDIPSAADIRNGAFNGCTALITVTIGSGCNINATSGLPNGFITSYNGTSKAAGTYTWNGVTWDFTP